jgi:hypothetical protein
MCVAFIEQRNTKAIGCLPIARVAVHSDVTLARIGLQKQHCNILFHGCIGCAIEIKVVLEAREAMMEAAV